MNTIKRNTVLSVLCLVLDSCTVWGQLESDLQPLDPHRLNTLSDDCDLCPGFNYGEGMGDEESPFTNTYLKSKTTCVYAPKNTVDGDPKTAWVEGVKGIGIGAEIIIPKPFNPNNPVKIWAGYGKSNNLFYANNRPKKIKVSVLKAREAGDWVDPHDATGCSQLSFGGFKTVAFHTIDLQDVNGFQDLSLPSFRQEKYKDFPPKYYSMDWAERENHQEVEILWDYSYFLKLEILEVYKGNKYDDTCISEIAN